MKKLLKILLLSSIFAFPFLGECHAALQGDAVWEVRTTGDDTNGGCYDYGGSGTDYSQQDAAQLSLTDLAMTAASTTLTSATGGFTAAMVDNCIQIASGTNFVAGFYEITGYTSSNQVTLDRTAVSGGDGTSGVGKVGGALAHIGKAAASVDMGHHVYVKAGTYQKYGANDYVMAIADDNNYGNFVWYECYKTTRGDAPTGTDRCVLDGDAGGASQVTTVVETGGNDGWHFDNFIIQKAATHNFDGGGIGALFNSRVTAAGSDGFDSISVGFFFSECDTNGDECMGTSGSHTMFSSYLHDNAVDAIDGGNVASSVFSVYDSNGGYGPRPLGYYIFANNVVYNNASTRANGDNSNNSIKGIYANNIFASNTYGFYCDNVVVKQFYNNIFYDNTTNLSACVLKESLISGNPNFNNAASGDFTITSGSSALDTGISIGDASGITGTYPMNIGVDMDDLTSGGSSAHSYGFSN